jgi:CRISPR-associated protein Csd1
MILYSLTQYYDRVTKDPDHKMPPFGFAYVEISFALVLNLTGKLVQIEDLRSFDSSNRLRGKSVLAPTPISRASNIAANLLWDNTSYVFGPLIEKSKSEERLQAFIERIKNEIRDSPKKMACLTFLESLNESTLAKFSAWAEVKASGANVSFRFIDDLHLFCQDEDLTSVYPAENDGPQQPCLVTGELDSIARLHTDIKGIVDAPARGANIVSFNLPPFNSYGKKQGNNAPIGEVAMFKYTSALNDLLTYNSRQKIQTGDATTIFWAKEKDPFEGLFFQVFGQTFKDSPKQDTELVRAFLQAPITGEWFESNPDNSFYVLGLAPSISRIIVRFWIVGKISEFSAHIKSHFDDLEIIKGPFEPAYYSIQDLLLESAIQRDKKNIPPHASASLMMAALQGTQYPLGLYQQILRRIQNDSSNRVNAKRAAVIKAYLNRKLRFFPNSTEKELQMALDINQPSIGYQLGRLMATLEKIQLDSAKSRINATIVDRYYGSACSTPVAVFGTLMRLMRHHINRIEQPGRRIWYENLIAEILGNVTEFPAHLNINEQGKFAVGYYHQKQNFYTKVETEGEVDEN